MEFALFERLQPLLTATGMAYLQGWGEPLTHPEFVRFTRFAFCRPWRQPLGNPLG